jgi:ribosomal protein L37E
MSEPTSPDPATRPPRPVTPIQTACRKEHEKVLCDRCGGEVYRMHAVWRCASCGFKSDCCGW